MHLGWLGGVLPCVWGLSIFPATSKWPGDHIYTGHKHELAVWSHWAHFCVGIGTFDARASVLQVTLSIWTSRWTF